MDWGNIAGEVIASALVGVVTLGVRYIYNVNVTLRELCLEMKTVLGTIRDHNMDIQQLRHEHGQRLLLLESKKTR